MTQKYSSDAPEINRGARLTWPAILIALAVAVVLIGLAFVVAAAPNSPTPKLRAFIIPSSAMEPTVLQGDHIIADMNYYRSRKPRDGDIVLYERRDTVFIKRIIASQGETVKGSGGSVYIDGKLIHESYPRHTGNPAPFLNDFGGDPLLWLNEFGPLQVPADSYFVIGDNRDVSIDSRTPDYGVVTAESIVGRPLWVLFNAHAGRFGKSIQ